MTTVAGKEVGQMTTGRESDEVHAVRLQHSIGL